MRPCHIWVILLMALPAACRHAAPPAGINPAGAGEFSQIENLGRELYQRENLITQAMGCLVQERIDLYGMGIHGWITEQNGRDWRVRFVKDKDDELTPCYDVIFAQDGKPQIEYIKTDDLSESQKAMFRAGLTAMSVIRQPCSEHYNPVVMPNPPQPGWVVFLLATTNDPAQFMVGGHYKAVISQDGRTVIETRPATQPCMALPRSSDDPASAQIVGYSMPHLLDETPMEIHVFLNLIGRKPFYVVTKKGLWSVIDGRIKFIREYTPAGGRTQKEDKPQ